VISTREINHLSHRNILLNSNYREVILDQINEAPVRLGKKPAPAAGDGFFSRDEAL